jgi:hypothetical protein
MQRAGLNSLLFPAKVHLTKVAPAVINRRVNLGPCLKPNIATKGNNMARSPISPALEPLSVKRTAETVSSAGQPICPRLKQSYFVMRI